MRCRIHRSPLLTGVAGLALCFALATPALPQIPPLQPDRSDADLVLVRSDWIAEEPHSLEELLRWRAGIVLSRRGGLGSIEFVQVAGSAPGRVRLLLNGVEMSEPELDWPRLYTIQVSMIERIEVHRNMDPAVLSIWTREVELDSPHVDFDLAKGGLDTRDRRVQFFTPRRAESVTLSYEELLRGEDDFRSTRRVPADASLGEYSSRSLLVHLDVRRPGEQLLRLEHLRHEDQASGDIEAQDDFARSHYTHDVLRWERGLGRARLVLDVSHQAWDRKRVLGADPQRASEARTGVAADLALPSRGPWSSWLRLRATEATGDRLVGGNFSRSTDEIGEGEVQLRRRGRVEWAAWSGVHHHGRFGATWSARLRAAVQSGAWSADAQTGRGVSFPGYTEATATGARTGIYASAGVRRRGERVQLQLAAYAKRASGPGVAPLFFPTLGAGPERVAGVLADATWRGGSERWHRGLSMSGACTPWVRGDRSGMPRLEARLLGELGRESYGGDLVITLRVGGSLATRRELTQASALAAFAAGEAEFEMQFLKRAAFFWSERNVLDARYETAPGVRLPGRTSLVGLRVRLID